jgi:hypothetical protein
MTKPNDSKTQNSRHRLNEIELMCSVMMEDSEWLDSYQTTLLENNMEKTERIAILNDISDITTSTSEQQQQQLHRQDSLRLNFSSAEYNFGESKHKYCPQEQLPSVSEFNDLPAREFVFGSKSFVATESVRLLRRVASESFARKQTVNHTILFKKPQTKAEFSASHVCPPFSISGPLFGL